MFLFGHPPLRAGRCLFLETLFFGRSGSPGSWSNSRHPAPAPSLHPGLPPWVPAALAFLARLLPAGRTWAGSWRGGPAPARKLESFVFAPRPARRGEEGVAEAALGRPRAGRVPVLASAPGFFRLFLSGWVCGFPEAIKTGPASLPTGLSASSAPFPGPGLVAHLGLIEEEQQALELGPCSALHAAFSPPSLSLPFSEQGERMSPRRVFVDSGRKLMCARSV